MSRKAAIPRRLREGGSSWFSRLRAPEASRVLTMASHSADKLIGITINQHIALEYVFYSFLRVIFDSAHVEAQARQNSLPGASSRAPTLLLRHSAISTSVIYTKLSLTPSLLTSTHRQRKYADGATGSFSNLLTEVIVVRIVTRDPFHPLCASHDHALYLLP